ncbi:DUF3883 domain-containing protein [Halomonas sp. GXIMD04776]|uniref:DUF3883 domain-containing protein n=1 Tax=Halomonas sp. GXIMD04776 TaxID=3415605 RepID=UPI003CBD596D
MSRGISWSTDEIEATVDTYRQMLIAELGNQRYNKAELNRALASRLSKRSRTAIEYKHQNISAVLRDANCPYVAGYKPMGNYQALLATIVERRLLQSELFDQAARLATDRPTIDASVDALDGVVVPPPSTSPGTREAPGRYTITCDYLARETRNRTLGDAGERFVLAYEQHRLDTQGFPELARAVEHVAETKGDGLGFDIRSFGNDGRERWIEVKTTAFAKECAFFVTPNELECSRQYPSRYYLYRLFNFRERPQMFYLQGDLNDQLWLQPDSYRAGIR